MNMARQKSPQATPSGRTRSGGASTDHRSPFVTSGLPMVGPLYALEGWA